MGRYQRPNVLTYRHLFPSWQGLTLSSASIGTAVPLAADGRLNATAVRFEFAVLGPTNETERDRQEPCRRCRSAIRSSRRITQFNTESAKQREVRQEDFHSGPAGHHATRPSYPSRASRPFALSASNSFHTHTTIDRPCSEHDNKTGQSWLKAGHDDRGTVSTMDHWYELQAQPISVQITLNEL